MGETEAEVLRRLMTRRFSCRAFRPEPVPDAVIGAIVETARATPSWCNTQPWGLVVTRPGTTEPLAQALVEAAMNAKGVESDLPFPERYSGERQTRRRASGFALYDAVGIAHDDKQGRQRQMLENFRFFGAPHVAILTTAAELGPYGGVDCGAFLQSFMLAAEAEGVATIPQAALAQVAPVLKRHLDIPADRWVVCGISFGYADMTYPANSFRTSRAGVEEILRFA